MKMRVNGREYDVTAMVNPSVCPNVMKNKSAEYFVKGARGSIGLLTAWSNGAWSFFDMKRTFNNACVEAL